METRAGKGPSPCGGEGGCEACAAARTTIRTEKLKSALLARLNRVEGQVRGIRGMVERDAYCDDILNQVAAARAALDGVNKLLLESHIRGCVTHKLREGDDDIVDELIATIGRML